MNPLPPSSWRPSGAGDFIGPARRVAGLLDTKLERLAPDYAARFLFYGPGGTGKTELGRLIARRLCAHPSFVEHLNGQSMSVERVRDWEAASHYLPIGGGRTVKFVDEFDKAGEAALSELRTFLDNQPGHIAVVVTTNRDVGALREASDPILYTVQRRFLAYRVGHPTAGEIAALLESQWKLPPAEADRLAEAAGGCLASALLDAESWMDAKLVAG